MSKKKAAIVSAEVPSAISRRLRAAARKNDRSISAEIRRALIFWFERQPDETCEIP